jgi:hypothetical protein
MFYLLKNIEFDYFGRYCRNIGKNINSVSFHLENDN